MKQLFILILLFVIGCQDKQKIVYITKPKSPDHDQRLIQIYAKYGRKSERQKIGRKFEAYRNDIIEHINNNELDQAIEVIIDVETTLKKGNEL
jgi:hypothetical protein